PSLTKSFNGEDPSISVTPLIQNIRKTGRAILSESESKQVLSAYGIPVVQTRNAYTHAEAVKIARDMGYPVVLKLLSETITHKTDVGGVCLNLSDDKSVEDAFSSIRKAVSQAGREKDFLGVSVQPMIKMDGYEIIIGSSLDPQFGPVLLFGWGGQLVEILKDSALALPPLNTVLARRVMQQTRIYEALKGVRGRKPVDLEALEQILVRFSQLVIEQRWIKEIDINPFYVSSEQMIALDARIILHDSNVQEENIPKPAIRPYPTQYVQSWTMRSGGKVLIRPIRPEDEPIMVKFHETLSEKSVYNRFFRKMDFTQRVAHERLARVCFIDYDRQIALVVLHRDPDSGFEQVLGVGRLTKLHGLNEAVFTIVIGDQSQHQGLGKELLHRLIQIARDEKLESLSANILSENTDMQKLCKGLGMQLKSSSDGTLMQVSMKL
ncbi:MAG: GNAT family N-acetyltransferase, partial [Chlamydiota bacterium]|nr:GNAT family N-acetyltransferase [Chlamydiota bacterium]